MRNYRAFFGLVTSIALFSAFQLGVAGYVLYLDTTSNYYKNSAAGTTSYVFLLFFMCLLIAVLGADGHLLFFHMLVSLRLFFEHDALYGLKVLARLISLPPPLSICIVCFTLIRKQHTNIWLNVKE